MADNQKRNDVGKEQGAHLSDEQLEDASGGDITLKRGYVSTDELWVWRNAERQDPDEMDQIKQGE